MKKLIFTLLACLCFGIVEAESLFYRASFFAYKCVDNDNHWNEWSDWEPSKIVLSIDTDKETITIYSEQEQRYIILDRGDDDQDAAGGEQVEFSVIDQDGDSGVIRVRAQKNSVLQLYVEFNNIMWVYSGLQPL
jgi:hypothetical protein